MRDKPVLGANEISVHTLLNDIKNGKVKAESLPKEARQLCVESLVLEGHQPSALAALLKVSDRTIKRDLNEIFERNAINPSPELARRLIGEFLQKMRIHHAYLMRLARSAEGSLQEKAYAESVAVQTWKEAIKILQSLGYLPSRPQEIVADFFHHAADGEESFNSLRIKIAEMEALAQELGGFKPDLAAKLEALKVKLSKAEVQHEVLKLTQAQKEVEDEQSTV